LRVGEGGILVGEPLDNLIGVLAGVPQFDPNAKSKDRENE